MKRMKRDCWKRILATAGVEPSDHISGTCWSIQRHPRQLKPSPSPPWCSSSCPPSHSWLSPTWSMTWRSSPAMLCYLRTRHWFLVSITKRDWNKIFILSDAKETSKILRVTQVVDQIAISFFTIEYLLRFALSPRKRKFFFNKMNLVDFVAIIPFYVALLLEGLEDLEIIGKAGKIIRLIRIMRILRIFKMVRHFVGLQSLVYTLHQAYKDLGLILVIVSVTVLMFSSMVFAFERESIKFFYISFICYIKVYLKLQTMNTGHSLIVFGGV